METLAGTTIGGYSLVRAIGSGPTGEVLVAEKESEPPYAVKVIHKKLSLFSRVEAYWDDIQAIAQLSNPYAMAPTVGDWSKGGRFYMVMPLLDGMDLSAVLAAHGRLPARQVLLLLGQACLALEAAHEAGLVHGAVKPRNIFLVPKDDPARFSTRLLDFAASSLVETDKIPDEPVGAEGVPDPAYLAPEQLQGETRPESDIYALGVVLFEALGGKRPFGGTYEEIAQQQISLDPEIPHSMPEPLARIVLKAMAKDAARRHASVAALREDLEAWASSSPPELAEDPVEIFSAEVAAAAKPEKTPAPRAESTVRVPVDELDGLFDEDEVDEALAGTSSRPVRPVAAPATAPVPEARAPEELAAAAAKTAVPPAAEKKPAGPPPLSRPRPKAPVVESYRDGDGDLVVLPVERSVKAFVAGLAPVDLPAEADREAAASKGNGESLETALDAFIEQAVTWSASLPLVAAKGQDLEELARPPKPPEPEPPPAPAAPPAPEPQPVVVAAPMPFPLAPPPRQRSIVPFMALGLVIGGALVFGGMKLFEPEPAPPVDQATPPPATAPSGSGTPVHAPPPEPVKAAPEEKPTAAAPGPGTEPVAPPVTAPLDDPAKAPPPGEAKAPPPDEAKAPPPGEAKAPPPDEAKAPPPDEARPPEPPAKVAKKPRPAVVKKPRPAAAKVAKKPPAAKKPAKKEPPAKKPKSDWVDPFSQ